MQQEIRLLFLSTQDMDNLATNYFGIIDVK